MFSMLNCSNLNSKIDKIFLFKAHPLPMKGQKLSVIISVNHFPFTVLSEASATERLLARVKWRFADKKCDQQSLLATKARILQKKWFSVEVSVLYITHSIYPYIIVAVTLCRHWYRTVTVVISIQHNGSSNVKLIKLSFSFAFCFPYRDISRCSR